MLIETLARVDALKAELDALRQLKPEHEQRLWQKLRLEWNYNSNHIEGNTLTYGETFLLLIHDKTNGGHTMREFEEMKAHDLAVSKVVEWSSDKGRSLTEGDVRDLNKILLKEPFWKEAITPDGQPTRVQIFPGEYKRQPNNVRLSNGKIFPFASVEETPVKMRELMDWFTSATDMHPVEKAAKFHHDFVLIHPFGDGNGRAARLVVNYILMSAGYMPLVIKSVDKTNYLNVLQIADAGDLLPLTEYLAKEEEWVLELGVKAARGESVEEPTDVNKRIDLLKRNTAHVEGPKESMNEEVIARIYYESLRSLFASFVNDMHTFSELFKETAYFVEIGRKSNHYDRESCIRALDNAFNELLLRCKVSRGEHVSLSGRTHNFKDLTLETMDHIGINVLFREFQRGDRNIFDGQGNLKVSFGKFIYTIEVPGLPETKKEFLYHQFLPKELEAGFIDAAKKQTLESIENRLGSKKS